MVKKIKALEEATGLFTEIPPLTAPLGEPVRPRAGKGPKRPGRPKTSGVQKASRGRRVFEPYALQDPDEARAVPETVHPGSLLERIQYKRNLVLFGAPSESNWTAQHIIPGGPGGIRLDFVYWFVAPPVVIEPQGLHWHDPSARPGDDYRAFVIRGQGFRYYELFEDDILRLSDEWLDNELLRIVGDPQLDPSDVFYSLNYPSVLPPGFRGGPFFDAVVFKETRKSR